MQIKIMPIGLALIDYKLVSVLTWIADKIMPIGLVSVLTLIAEEIVFCLTLIAKLE